MLKNQEDIRWTYKIDESELEKDLVLIDNVQFIYELSLAELELKALGVDFTVLNGLREFIIHNKNKDLIDTIRKRTSYFKSVSGKLTDYFYIIQKNRTKSVNQYLTHWIYPYKGKFHPQMIRALLNIIGMRKGDLVCDPFSGSGTTALESQLLGINFYGIDVSPLCVLQGKVKTKSVEKVIEIKEIKNEIINRLNQNLFNSEANYYKILEDIKDEDVRNFYLLARLVAISDNARRGKEFEKSFVKNLNLMVDSVEDYKEVINKLKLNLGTINIEVGDVRKINLPDNSVDGIITSPPYSIALDYVENDEHSLIDLGYEIDKLRDKFIGVRGNGKNKIELYNEDMKKAYSEFYRILKPNKYAVIVIGNATFQGREVQTVEFTIDYMQNLGFAFEKNILKLIFGLYNVMKKENILIFKKMN
ncbi:MAG: DNA methyltransferase [Ignavibacterium sp.]|nr:DNA methyltransferase [Ignavibacterium sp.]MDW8374987.1 DNA methyltransferase [Ignavibacteriales bacterium]